MLHCLKPLFTKKIILRLYLPLAIAGLFIFFFCYHKVAQHAKGRTYYSVKEVPYNRVGLLLGTCKLMKDKKTINPFWQFRVEAAYRLWKAKKIEKLLVSGDIGWYGQNELEDFREAFLALGIPDSAMVFDYVGFRTHDSVIRCKEVFGQKKVTIISQEFHNERALYIADHFGLEAVGYNAEMVSFRDNIRNSIRERLARILLFMDLYVLDSEPHILGRKVVIP